jgi:hypothetical protein
MIGPLLTLLFYLGALGFLATKQTDRSGAKSYAVVGFAILLLLCLSSMSLPLLLSQFPGFEYFPMYFGIYSLVTSILHAIAMGLLIAAIFVGRKSWADQETGVDSKRPPIQSDNPYSPPAN